MPASGIRSKAVAREVDAWRERREGIPFQLGRSYRAYVQVLQAMFERHGIADIAKPGMGYVLFALFEQDGQQIKELAGRAKLASPTVTRLVDRMIETGLVERIPDENDRRAVCICLTAKGGALRKTCAKIDREFVDLYEKELSREELEQLRNLLMRLTRALQGGLVELKGQAESDGSFDPVAL